MKKDKSVRKAEWKAALKSNLKSMIGPMILFLIILAGVLVVVFYKDETEAPEIIKVNGYDGESTELVLENDKLKFVMNSDTTQFEVIVKETGEVWSSNPEAADADALAFAAEKAKLKSTLLVTYSNKNGVDIMYNNYQYSMQNKIFEYEITDDSIRVNYSIGDVEKEYIIPLVMTEERYDNYMQQMSGSEKNLLSQYYKKYDINNLGKKENKEELVARYPLMEQSVIYVVRDTTKDAVKRKLEEVFVGLDYTYEEYLEDKLQDLGEKISDKPVYNISMIYRLDGDDLVVEIPFDSIEYPEDKPIYQLTVLPYFGAAESAESGFMLVPEGGGALIMNNNGKTLQNSYYANVYGWDMASERDAVVHETRTYYNVFGAAREKSSYLCVLEQGAPYAAIQADISGKNNSYNYVNAIYTMLKRDIYNVTDRADGVIYVYQEQLPAGESIKQRYCFIDSGSYVDMAENYHDYLINQYADVLKMNTDTEAPVIVDIIGAVDRVEQVVGIPMSRPLPLTTIEEAEGIIKQLYSEGLKNMSVKLSGFINGGVKQKILHNVKLTSCLGKEKNMNQMVAAAQSLGISMYLDGITDYAIDSDWFDGFTVYSQAARFTSREKAELYKYSDVTYAQRDSLDSYYLLKQPLTIQMMQNLAEAAKKYQLSVSFQNTGYELSGDYTRKAPYSRQTALNSQVETVKQLSSEQSIMINMGNDYVAPYADVISNMDLGGFKYTIIDYQVPFYQLALHGYINYTGEAINLTQNSEEELLKSAEYGAGLAFTVMEESPFSLQNTLYYQYFGAEYEACHDTILAIYNRYNEEMGHIFDQRMSNHEYLDPEFTCTTYEDGTKVYVNYDYDNEKTIGQVVVPARDYVVVK